jgi:hypothetical protein
LEWHSEDQGDWVQDAERWINQIKGVLQCKIDIDGGGDISSVHVVAQQGRDPRHIVRDVEGLLKARLGIAVFYKKIGVVQVVEPPRESLAGVVSPAAEPVARPVAPEPALDLDDDAEDDDLPDDEPDERLAATTEAILLAEEMAPRVKCGGVGLKSTETIVRAEVDLAAAGLSARGVAEGPNRSASDIDLIAQATLAAVQSLLDEAVTLNLCEVRVDPLGGQKVVLVAVEIIEGRRAERLFGTCQPQQNLHQAVVFAVLDALNRRLALMAFKSGEAAS